MHCLQNTFHRHTHTVCILLTAASSYCIDISGLGLCPSTVLKFLEIDVLMLLKYFCVRTLAILPSILRPWVLVEHPLYEMFAFVSITVLPASALNILLVFQA